jgi:hypothetical protein
MKNIHILPTDKPSRLVLRDVDKKLVLHTPITQWHGKSQTIHITSDEEIKEGDWVINLKSNQVYQIFILNEVVDYEKKIILTTDPDLIKDGVQAIDDEFLEWFVKNPSCERVEVEDWLDNKGCISWGLAGRYQIIIPKEEPKQIYYNTVGRENGISVIKGQFNTQKEALDLADELNRKFPHLYYDWRETLVKEKPKQETLEGADKVLETEINYWYKETGSLTSENIVRRAYSLGITEGAKKQAERMYSEEDVINALHSVELKDNKNYSKVYTGMKEWFEQFKKE